VSSRLVAIACTLLFGLGLAACSTAHSATGRLLTRDAPVPTSTPDASSAAADTPAVATTNDVGPADPTPVLQTHTTGSRSSGGGGGGAAVGTGHTVARAAPARPAPFANLAPPGATPNVWAVVIGVQQYQGRTHPTVGGEGDANAFMQVLGNAHWPSDHILELVDGAATAGNIRNAMQWLVQHSGPNTLTVFHYSGHVCISSSGPCGANHMYLWSVDNQFISDDEVGSVLSGLQGTAWVDIAGCEAGAFDKGISNGQRLFTGSSQANEKSYEDPDWHESVWTGLAVDQGMLQGAADSNGDHKVTVREAANWARPRANQITQGQPNGAQTPVINGGPPDIDLAAAATPPPPPPPPPPSSNGGGGNGGGQPAPPPKNCVLGLLGC